MDVREFAEKYRARTGRSLLASLNGCLRCGLCAETCHYYVADPKPEHIPAYRAEAVRRLLRRESLWGRMFPGLTGACSEEGEEAVAQMADVVFGTCTMCNRCAINCPVGIDTAQIVRTARGVLSEAEIIPSGLRDTVAVHRDVGNNMGIEVDDFIDTLQWMEEQLKEELGDPNAAIPLDKKGATYLYTLNPREIKFYPLSILAAAKIFYAAKADWTLSTKYWDVTNYALFSGEDDLARENARRLRDVATELGVKTVVMAECGHGFRSFRWEGSDWLATPLPFDVISMVELMACWIDKGVIKVKKIRSNETFAYHDPCNQARNGGIVNEPRFVLSRVVDHFQEMTPHGVENYCCGGGGGMLAMTEYASRRLAAGGVKAKQIEATEADVVVTSCHNCLDQLAELKKHYKLKVQIMNLSELVADALLI